MDYHQRELYDWLSPPDPSANYQKALQQRHAGTGSWFLHGPRFDDWLKTNVQALWLYGIPGCGKSVLASSIIENLEAQSPEVPLLYYFFDFQDVKKQTLDGAIRALIAQLAIRDKAAYNILDAVFKSDRAQAWGQYQIVDLARTLDEMMSNHKQCRIVLDALDECRTRDELLTWLHDNIRSRENVQLIVTSRRESDIEYSITQWMDKEQEIWLAQEEVGEDIRSYIHGRIRSDSWLRKWEHQPEVQNDIETELTRKAEGMFRWVACQLDSLATCVNRKQVKAALASLPRTLDETYALILRQIPKEYEDDAVRLLQAITYSERPLRLSEAIDLLAVELGEVCRFDPNDRMPSPRDVLKLCSSLITLVEEDEVTLRLAHFSVQEYLKSQRLETRYLFSFSEDIAKRQIAGTLVVYILHLDHTTDLDEVMQRYPLAQFASQYWAKFVRHGEHDIFLQEKIMSLLTNKDVYGLCLALYDPEGNYYEMQYLDREPTCPPAPLYYATIVGLEAVVEGLLAAGYDVDAVGGYYGTPLTAAAAAGSTNILRRLFEWGASIPPKALHVASEKGNCAVIRTLLDNGADATYMVPRLDCSPFYIAPLHCACNNGNADAVQMLLDAGADPNTSPDKSADNAFLIACRRGHVAVAKVLITAGAQYDHYRRGRGECLRIACEMGHRDIVQLLLDQKVGGEAALAFTDREFGRALEGACMTNQKSIVCALLDAGCHPNGGGALTRTCLEGNDSLAELLLDRGANPDASVNYLGQPLIGAIANKRSECVRLLLRRGANFKPCQEQLVNFARQEGSESLRQDLLDMCITVDPEDWEIFHSACRETNLTLANALLDRGLAIDVQRINGRTALCHAVEDNNTETVKFLIERGADVNIGAPLVAACWQGNDIHANMLLEHGASVEPPDEWPTPLTCACSAGSEALFQTLLAKGAKIAPTKPTKLSDTYYGPKYLQHGYLDNDSPLTVACSKDRESMVTELLARGADPTSCECLHAAAYHGHERMVRLLLRYSPNINAENINGKTALFRAITEKHEGIVRILLKYGMDSEISAESFLRTHLFVATEEKHEVIMEMFLEHATDMSVMYSPQDPSHNSLSSAARKGWEGGVHLLLRYSARMGYSSREWLYTPLIEACRGGHLSVISILLRAGADAISSSALATACQCVNISVVRLLLRYDTDSKLIGVDGKNEALQQVCNASRERLVNQEACKHIVQLLSVCGADIGTLKQTYRFSPMIQEVLRTEAERRQQSLPEE